MNVNPLVGDACRKILNSDDIVIHDVVGDDSLQDNRKRRVKKLTKFRCTPGFVLVVSCDLQGETRQVARGRRFCWHVDKIIDSGGKVDKIVDSAGK